MSDHPPEPGPSPLPPDSAVERSRRLRKDARARLDAARRSLHAVSQSYEYVLNRRIEPDRRKPAAHVSEPEAPALVEDLFHGFLDTEPQVHWLLESRKAADDARLNGFDAADASEPRPTPLQAPGPLQNDGD